MSGGVDSSVAAALCVAAGLPVVGIMLRLWAEPGASGANKCCTLGAVDDARAVADRLGIPFSVLDVAELFKATVVDPFVAAAGRLDTPNPCFGCNRHMRFGHLLSQARALGADYLATGHYARLATDAAGQVHLLRANDAGKDQSYVLHRLGPEQLARALFPLGELQKPAVRQLARDFGLPVAERPDSVDLCWVGRDGVAGFLRRSPDGPALLPGPILDTAGQELGRHQGLPLYTLGQRRGLGVATGQALFVVAKDAAANALVLGQAEELLVSEVVARDWQWVGGTAPDLPCRVSAQIRYRSAALAGWLTAAKDGAFRVSFDAPQRAPAPGQGLVVYDGDDCLGGGRIVAEG
jgi:tRNA-specific 2-thiouridylase